MAAEQREKMKVLFKQYKYMTATSDVWSRSNRSFIAVTVHAIDEKSLATKSYFIACESFPGRHNTNTVAEKLHGIFLQYGILLKVFFITTDGAGEYVAGIREHGDQNRSITALTDLILDGEGESEDYCHELELDDYDDYHLSPAPTDNSNQAVAEARAGAGTSSNSNFVVTDPFENCDEDVQGQLPLLPKLNRIGCSSHMFDKVNIQYLHT